MGGHGPLLSRTNASVRSGFMRVPPRGRAPVQGLVALAITSKLFSRYPLMQSQKYEPIALVQLE